MSLDSDSGILRTSTAIDREEFPFLEATVEVRDSNGLAASHAIRVEVVDENDSPSQPRTLTVVIKNYEGTFPGGQILTVRPADPDTTGQYRCRLLQVKLHALPCTTGPRYGTHIIDAKFNLIFL